MNANVGAIPVQGVREQNDAGLFPLEDAGDHLHRFAPMAGIGFTHF